MDFCSLKENNQKHGVFTPSTHDMIVNNVYEIAFFYFNLARYGVEKKWVRGWSRTAGNTEDAGSTPHKLFRTTFQGMKIGPVLVLHTCAYLISSTVRTDKRGLCTSWLLLNGIVWDKNHKNFWNLMKLEVSFHHPLYHGQSCPVGEVCFIALNCS